jgi:ABC-type sugar transport system ATPase subunit
MAALHGVIHMTETALSMQGISKSFPGTLAVDKVNFDLAMGEVHALMGENGAGKSTLMKTLTGCFGDYDGTIQVNGKEASIHSPADAKEHGIGMVYQELSLARPISIAENLLAGRLPSTRWGVLDSKKMKREAALCLKSVGLDLDPRKTIEEISQHEAQLIEIAKVLGNQPRVLILDEPTSALSRDEVRRLFEIIRDLKQRGLAIIYISHHLPEVFEVADRVTIMRDGKKMGTHDIADVTPESLVQLMVGQRVDEFYSERNAVIGQTALRVERLTRFGFFHDVSFELRKGEILGLVGLSGAGRTDLGRSLCGLDPLDFGHVTLHEEEVEPENYPAAVSKGLVYLSENRKEEGLFLRLSVQANLLAARLPFLSKAGIYAPGNTQSYVQGLIDELDIVTSSNDADTGTLSGGNQQKVLLGKWLATEPEVLILDEPSRGVDINAKRRIHRAVMNLADKGKAILLISSYLPELVGLADRAIVLRNGRLIGELRKDELSEESVLLAANGQGMGSNV